MLTYVHMRNSQADSHVESNAIPFRAPMLQSVYNGNLPTHISLILAWKAEKRLRRRTRAKRPCGITRATSGDVNVYQMVFDITTYPSM